MTDPTPQITPPPELVQQWLGEFFGCTVSGELSDSEKFLATQAARSSASHSPSTMAALAGFYLLLGFLTFKHLKNGYPFDAESLPEPVGRVLFSALWPLPWILALAVKLTNWALD